MVTYQIDTYNIALPVQILKYDIATKSYNDVTKQFFGSDVPQVVAAYGVVIDDFNDDG